MTTFFPDPAHRCAMRALSNWQFHFAHPRIASFGDFVERRLKKCWLFLGGRQRRNFCGNERGDEQRYSLNLSSARQTERRSLALYTNERVNQPCPLFFGAANVAAL